MTHVVTESCIRCKYTDCVEVCPVDCFHQEADLMAIDPDACIDCSDCSICVSECSVFAIEEEGELPTEQGDFPATDAAPTAEWLCRSATGLRPDDAGGWTAVAQKIRFHDNHDLAAAQEDHHD